MIANKRIGVVLVLAAAAAAGTQDPAATLRPDALDAPAETSVREAQRAADLAASGHVMTHGTYRQVDAGRDETPAIPQTGHQDPHAGHDMPAQEPTPPDPHAGHQMPAPDPHAGHQMPAPKPSPSPSPKGNR